MQAWGFRSRFDNRDTGLEPTRSGIIGLLCAALGWGRDTDLSRFQNLRVGVRADQEGRVALDYHTAQNVWREGADAGTVVSNRYYLADARFLVGLECEDRAWLEALEAALRDPRWPLFLGRKSFTPSVPVALSSSGLREGDCESVLRSAPWYVFSRQEQKRETEKQARQEAASLRLVLETKEPAHGVAKNDVPRDFARRNFGVRYLRTEYCDLLPPQLHPLMEHAL